MIEVSNSINDEAVYPVWNPEIPFIINKNGCPEIRLSIQEHLHFEAIKPLSIFYLSCDVQEMKEWKPFPNFDGTKSLKDICMIIHNKMPEISYESIKKNLLRYHNKGLFIFYDKNLLRKNVS